jgi:hypothetical protein
MSLPPNIELILRIPRATDAQIREVKAFAREHTWILVDPLFEAWTFCNRVRLAQLAGEEEEDVSQQKTA